MAEEMTVLIIVKTYPLPSKGYQELVCTAGVLENGSFVRLYPIDYRYRPYCEWFSKYQWVRVVAEKNPKDRRPESFRPVVGSQIVPLGEPLKPNKNWAERKKYVLAQGVQTMCSLEALPRNRKSLGIIRPLEVKEFVAEEVGRVWKPQWLQLFQQQKLFGPRQKPLEKIPYKFSYVFTCGDPGCKGHKKMIEDWELGQLYRFMRDKYKSEEAAVQKVKEKFYDQICAAKIDTHFFVGTVSQYGSWVILGAFWPEKE